MQCCTTCMLALGLQRPALDRKSTRLNSSHSQISYAVFCLKKKKRSTATVALFTIGAFLLAAPTFSSTRCILSCSVTTLLSVRTNDPYLEATASFRCARTEV